MYKRIMVGMLVLSAIIVVLMIFSEPPRPPEKPMGSGFTKELIEPCVDKEEGDVCVIENTFSHEESTCEYVDELLVCFPHRGPPPPGQQPQPPPEQ